MGSIPIYNGVEMGWAIPFFNSTRDNDEMIRTFPQYLFVPIKKKKKNKEFIETEVSWSTESWSFQRKIVFKESCPQSQRALSANDEMAYLPIRKADFLRECPRPHCSSYHKPEGISAFVSTLLHGSGTCSLALNLEAFQCIVPDLNVRLQLWGHGEWLVK